MSTEIEIAGKPADQPVLANSAAAAPSAPRTRTGAVIAQQTGCPTCGAVTPESSGLSGTTAPGFVYAIGRVEARFPNLAAEKEFAQATGRADTAGQTDQQTFHSVLSRRENRYLARQLCWVLTVQGQETYLLTPRDTSVIDLLIEAIRPAPSPNDVDVVIGVRGPSAPPQMCNGPLVPIGVF